MRILVTGASGFLGSHVAETLAKAGHEVTTLVRSTSSRSFLAFPHEEAIGDVTQPETLPNAVAGADVVVHAAGLVKARSEAEFAAVNARGTANLISAIESHAPGLKRFIYISSLAAHGPSDDGHPRPPSASPMPITAYGRTKLAGEEITRASSLAARSVIFRPPVIYGPRDPALVPFFRLTRMRLAPLLMGGSNRISIVYVEDAASAIALAATAEAPVTGKIYCPEDGAPHTWRDLLAAVEQAAGRSALRIHTPRWAFSAAAAVTEAWGLLLRRPVSLTREKLQEMVQPHWVCSSEELRRDLGWEPRVDIWEGARRTYRWYRAHGWI